MHSTLARMALNEEGFMFDPQTGESFLVNDTARELLEGLKQGLDQRQLAERLAAEWEVEPAEAERDVMDFLQQLRSLGLTS